jgi:hypothetical protein
MIAMNIRNAVKSLITSTVLAGIVVSCGGGDDDSTPAASTATVVRTASLAGVAPIAGTGRGAVVVNPTTKEITGGITFTGLTGAPTAADIRRADGNSAIALVLAADNATATVPSGLTPATGPVLSDADFAELLAGTLYFNVRTVANPDPTNGEIRGQITGQGNVIAGLATLTGAQENSTNISTATGRGTIVVDSGLPNKILIAYATHNVTNTTVAHIHNGSTGSPNNVGVLTPGTNVYTAPYPATLNQAAVTDLKAGISYFNIHSSNNLCPPAANCGAGEIRGQIAVQ